MEKNVKKKPSPLTDPASSGEVDELLKTLGVSSVEELRTMLSQNSISVKNRGIDLKNWLPGYY